MGILAMMTIMTFTMVTEYTIHSVSFESEELSSERMELSEMQMRHLLETSVNGLNGIQKSLKCCGLDNYTDWNSNADFMCVSPPMSTNSCSIPETCCEDYTENPSDTSRSRILFIQSTRIRQHCGKGALKPFVGSPEKSNSANDMKKDKIFKDGCLEKAKTFLSEFGTKNLIIGGFLLASQVYGVIASVVFHFLILCDRDGEGEAQDTARDRNNNNNHNQRNALQPRRNSNGNEFDNFELNEMDSSSYIAPDNVMHSDSDTATVHLSDTESRECATALVKLSDIASKKPAAITNRQHSESRNDAAATNLIDTESVRPTDTESMKRETNDVNPPVFESMNGLEASCSTIDVGSRPNSPESESDLSVKSSPTYKKISALFENTAGYKLEESQELLASEDSDVEDPAKSYVYDWNEMFFVTTTV